MTNGSPKPVASASKGRCLTEFSVLAMIFGALALSAILWIAILVVL